MPYQITARTADMSTRYIQYFTTALRISTAAFLLSHVSAWAQVAADVPQAACERYGLNVLQSPLDAGGQPWWFLSNEQGDSKTKFFSATLPILAVDRHVLWGVDSRILTQMKSTSAATQRRSMATTKNPSNQRRQLEGFLSC